jgi:hypothetical protein
MKVTQIFGLISFISEIIWKNNTQHGLQMPERQSPGKFPNDKNTATNQHQVVFFSS